MENIGGDMTTLSETPPGKCYLHTAVLREEKTCNKSCKSNMESL